MRLLIRAYEYFYFRIFDWQLRSWSETYHPQYAALIGATWMAFMNLYSLAILIENFTGVLLTKGSSLPIVAGLLIGIANAVFFLFQSRYKEIAKMFSQESSRKRKMHFWYCMIYVVVSMGILIALVEYDHSRQ